MTDPTRSPISQPSSVPVPPAPIALPQRPIPNWRLWLPLLLQVGLVLAVPARDAYTVATGTTVTLQTQPVDPYDLLRGYSQTLSFDISNPDLLKALPNGKLATAPGSPFYLVLAAPDRTTEPPQPWKPVRLSADRPTDLTDRQVAIQGQWQGGRLSYGLETYYMPEDQRQDINRRIGEIQQADRRSFVVEVKVDAAGNAVLQHLWLDDQRYRF